MSCGVSHACGSDPTLPWLWCSPEAAAPLRPLAREPPYVACAAPKIKKKNFTEHHLCAKYYFVSNVVRRDSQPTCLPGVICRALSTHFNHTYFSFSFFGCAHGMPKFPGQGLNRPHGSDQSHSSDRSHSSDSPKSLTTKPPGNAHLYPSRGDGRTAFRSDASCTHLFGRVPWRP